MFIIKVQRGEEKPEIFKVEEREEALALVKRLSILGAQIEMVEKNIKFNFLSDKRNELIS